MALSLAGAEALRTVPLQWAGLLSLIPVALGIRALWQLRRPDEESNSPIRADSTVTVALVTMANGGDNVSVYVPLFRHLDLTGTPLGMGVFAVLVAVWCTAALVLGRYARLVPAVIRVGRWLSPCLFIVIGVIICVRSGVLTRVVVTLHPAKINAVGMHG